MRGGGAPGVPACVVDDAVPEGEEVGLVVPFFFCGVFFGVVAGGGAGVRVEGLDGGGDGGDGGREVGRVVHVGGNGGVVLRACVAFPTSGETGVGVVGEEGVYFGGLIWRGGGDGSLGWQFCKDRVGG